MSDIINNKKAIQNQNLISNDNDINSVQHINSQGDDKPNAPNATESENDTFVIKSDYVHPVDDIFETSFFLPEPVTPTYDTGISPLTEKILNTYEEYKKEKKLIKVTITNADNHGNLHVPLHENILGIIMNEDVNGVTYDYKKRSVFVGRTLAVAVKDIDRSKGVIYLSRKLAKDYLRDRLRNELKPGMQVNARVLFVNPINKRVYIDIEGANLWGYIPIREWSHGFIYDPVNQIKKNEIVSVEVLRYQPVKGNYQERFICSRRNVLPDPWINIEKKYPKNSILLVRCMDVEPKKWFGRIPNAPGFDIDIYCEYPDPDKHMIIKKGHLYKVLVYRVDEKRRILRARPIDEVPMDKVSSVNNSSDNQQNGNTLTDTPISGGR